MKNHQSITNCLNLLDHFHKCAGLKLNKDKTEAIQLGIVNRKFYKGFGLKWSNGPLKVTGIWVGKDMKETDKNFFRRKN